MGRGGYEFSSRVRQKAIEKHLRENPESEEKLEVHHIVPVWWAKKENIPPRLVKVQDNAVALPVEKHREIHKENLSDGEYRVLAQSILGWVRNLI